MVEIELIAYVYGGETLGRLPDGRVIFVPFALPGERVRAVVREDKKRYARAELVEIISASPQRVEPRCLHYGMCGGCHYQHLPYELQLAAKQDILADQLRRIGGIPDPHLLPPVPSQPWSYRNHVQFHLTNEGRLGYYTHDASRVFPVQECHLPQALIDQVWPQLEFEALPDIERVGIRQGSDDDLQLILESYELELPELSIEELDISAVHLSPAGPLVLAGSLEVVMEVSGRCFQVSAGSFFQVNTRMAEAMVSHVVSYLLENLTLPSEAVVLEAYCGVGLFSAFLAPLAGRLVGIETSPEACQDFAANLDEFEHVELYEAAPEDVLPALKIQPDLVLVDPPRAGLGRDALQALAELSAPRFIYVSCDPATLARDARQLSQYGYTLQSSRLFDLFPQTYHIESVNIFNKPHT
ncbi:MAG: class I SAM-dependent RNA methyltransferase [Anaerolineales bacterium]